MQTSLNQVCWDVPKEECIDITSTLEVQLRDAGLSQTAAAVGALVLESELHDKGLDLNELPQSDGFS